MRQVAEEFNSPPGAGSRFADRMSQVQLTEREAEILDLMGEGLSTEEIAGRLFVAQVTVRSHIAAILKKLRVPDRKTAVQLTREQSGRPDLGRPR